MRTSTFAAVSLALGLTTATFPAFSGMAHAEGTAAEKKSPAKSGSKSLSEATGNLKTDATQTTKDAQSLNVDKTMTGAGQVKKDAGDVKESATKAMENPMGLMTK